MKTRGIERRPRPSHGHVAPIGRRPDGAPGIAARNRVTREPMMCERCGATYARKTWRGGERTRRTPIVAVTWTLCPACTQVVNAEYFGRVRILAPLAPAWEGEVRKRIRNVDTQARRAQPERQVMRIDRSESGLEILTTSQKLAHRVAHELKKAFGGRAHYTWGDLDGVLEATWDPPRQAQD